MKLALSIKTRLTLWFILIVLAFLTVFGVVAYFLLSQGLTEQGMVTLNVYKAQTRRETNGSIQVTGLTLIGITDILQLQDRNPDYGSGQFFAYTRDELQKWASPDGSFDIGPLSIDLNLLDVSHMSADQAALFYTYPSRNTASGYEMLVFFQSIVEVKRAIFAKTVLIMTLVMAVLTGIAGFLLVRQVLRPLQALTRAAGVVEEKNLGRRLNTGNRDEIGELTAALDQAFARLEKAFKREKEFAADVSHELRSTLAMIKGRATLALQKERNTEEYQRTLLSLSRETDHMAAVLKRLMTLAQYDRAEQLDMEEIDLKDFVADIASEAVVLAESGGVRLEVITEEFLRIKGDRVSLKELALNLIDNAMRYTPRGGTISLILGRRGENAALAVRDTGAGIPEEHLPHIFERFYRVDKAWSRSEGHAGLGLSICRRIAALHGGTIEVKSRVGEGSTFTVFFPLFIPESKNLPGK